MKPSIGRAAARLSTGIRLIGLVGTVLIAGMARSAPAAAAMPTSADPFAGLTPLSRAELGKLRGGLRIDGALISFGGRITASRDGVPIFETLLNFPADGPIPAPSFDQTDSASVTRSASGDMTIVYSATTSHGAVGGLDNTPAGGTTSVVNGVTVTNFGPETPNVTALSSSPGGVRLSLGDGVTDPGIAATFPTGNVDIANTINNAAVTVNDTVEVTVSNAASLLADLSPQPDRIANSVSNALFQ